jgi:hypothetical protein
MRMIRGGAINTPSCTKRMHEASEGCSIAGTSQVLTSSPGIAESHAPRPMCWVFLFTFPRNQRIKRHAATGPSSFPYTFESRKENVREECEDKG